MKDFNLKKYLAEGKLTGGSYPNYDKEVEYYAEDYEEIATNYMKQRYGGRNLGKMSARQLERLGQKIVDKKYDGDLSKAYQDMKDRIIREERDLGDYNEDIEKVIDRGIKRINIGSSDEEDVLYYVHNNWMGGNISAEEAMKKINKYLSE